jgi:hypothetical protein
MTHDVALTRKDGSLRNFRVYGLSSLENGDIITLPVDGQLIKARVNGPPKRPEIIQSADAEAVEV